MKIEEQLNLLVNFVKSSIDNDYVYLDIPGYFNVGDHLIYNGAMRVLQEHVPFKCLYQTVIENFDDKRIGSGDIIILQGGGNWGGGYYTPFRTRIIEQFPNNKIILFPQTIRYEDSSKMCMDAKIYAKHHNLHLCVRDTASFKILEDYFSSNYLHLLPDTAVGLVGALPKYVTGKAERGLLLKRTDGEASEDKWEIDDVDIETKDWNLILEELNFANLLWPYKVLRKARRMTGSLCLKNLSNRYFIKTFEPWILKHVPEYFLRYNKLYTTRLHGFILAKLLEMPVEWQDTRYGKISGYFNTWFEND